MFGWLAVHSATFCRRTHGLPAERRWLSMPPGPLVDHLPRLGQVLYLASAAPCVAAESLPAGWLVEQRDLARLLHTHWIISAGVVDSDGPREWLECVDRRGRIGARLHLLPDTDYLAWDALLAAGEAVPMPRFGVVPELFHPAMACVTRFHRYPLAGLTALGRDGCEPVSALGQDVAQRIARAEAVALQRRVTG